MAGKNKFLCLGETTPKKKLISLLIFVGQTCVLVCSCPRDYRAIFIEKKKSKPGFTVFFWPIPAHTPQTAPHARSPPSPPWWKGKRGGWRRVGSGFAIIE